MPRTRSTVLEERAEAARCIGRRLTRARERAGLTQLAAARTMGVPQSRIAKLESGTRLLLFIEGLRLAGLYAIPPAALDPALSDEQAAHFLP